MKANNQMKWAAFFKLPNFKDQCDASLPNPPLLKRFRKENHKLSFRFYQTLFGTLGFVKTVTVVPLSNKKTPLLVMAEQDPASFRPC